MNGAARLNKHDHVSLYFKMFLSHLSQEGKNYIYLVMEFCPGGDLCGYVADNHPLKENIVQNLSFQLMNGLKHLYEHKLVHRVWI